jgi:predicted nuclease with TOPRIM domain
MKWYNLIQKNKCIKDVKRRYQELTIEKESIENELQYLLNKFSEMKENLSEITAGK